MAEPWYPTLDDVIFLHDALVELSGHPQSPLLDPRKLDSALSRPRNAAHYEGADLVTQAAIMAVAISQSQAFLDGNKRAGFGAADVFLRYNGMRFDGDPLDFGRRLEQVAEASRPERDAAAGEFAIWLCGQVVPTDDPTAPN